MGTRKAKHGWLLTIIFTIISVAYLYPIALVFINSFKKKAYISKFPFKIPTDKMFVGLENYVRGIEKTGLIQAFGWSLFITIGSVAVIILCCSMCAWYISRVHTKVTKAIYVNVLICNGSTFPDGNVYIVKNCKYVKAWESLGNHHYLSGIWSRIVGIYVYRIHEIDSA